MSTAILVLFLAFNFAISWFNAWSVGRSWAETKAVGGFPRFMAWCGAVMSASGFTWCYLALLFTLNSLTSGKYHLPDQYADAVFQAGYLIIILPVLGSGLAITMQSWTYFWKERNFSSGAVAGWNTFAQIYDTYTALRAIPESITSLSSLWDDSKDDDDKSTLFEIAMALAVCCVIGGVVTTAVIVRITARKVASTENERMFSMKQVEQRRAWRT